MLIHRHIPLKRFQRYTRLCYLAAWCVTAAAQTAPQDSDAFSQILTRLDRLEKQNQQLVDELRALRTQLPSAQGRPESPPSSDVADKVDVQENRIEELAQTKLESSQRFPVRLTGMALFNAFLNSSPNGNLVTPVVAPLNGGALTGGATLRQTILGLEFRGPETFGGGRVRGVLNMDFFGGSGGPDDSLFRIRTASIQVDWKSTTVMFGQDKPLIAPREPNSLAQVGLSPLTGAGNLWIWQPQARIEQRLRLGEQTTLRAQAGVFATREEYGDVPYGYQSSLQSTRPGLQGRLAISHSLDDERRIEIGSGFHVSTTHVHGWSIPSRVFSVDWFVNPWRKLEFSGNLFRGENLTNVGGIGQGFSVLNDYRIIPVHAAGGWAQLALLATPRLSFHFFGGLQDNRDRDLIYSSLGANYAYAANIMYRLASNVIVSLETGQVRTDYVSRGQRLNNHHDLGLAYLF